MTFTCHGLDGPDEGLHVLLTARLVLVEVRPRAIHLVLAVGGGALVGLVALDLVWIKKICKKMSLEFFEMCLIFTFVGSFGLERSDFVEVFVV